MSTTICITIPATEEMYGIGYAISRALNPDRGDQNNFGSEFVLDEDENLIRPLFYTTYQFNCSPEFLATAKALAADPTMMHAAVSADYMARWPELVPPTLEQCKIFCQNVEITEHNVVEGN